MTLNPLRWLARIFEFLVDVFRHRQTIKELTRNDFRSRYLGSFLGITWAFIQPTITILIMWFIFEAGFKTGPVGDCPFVLWLMSGLLPWFFFSEGLQNATNSIIDNSYLVKKVVFKVSILPIIKILSSLIVHSFFISVLVLLFAVYQREFSLHVLQIPFFVLLTCLLVLGLSWLTSALVIFVRDLGQIIAILLQFGFWLTPIFWSMEMVPERYHTILKLNPVFFIVEGYRNSLIYHRWFWEHPSQAIYFFSVTGTVFFLGAFVFMRLRPHFADVI